jgi:uncharacterized RDD family membrane protein YckC
VTGGYSAGFGRRFAALLYDALLLAALMLIFTTALVMLFARSAILPETAGPWAYVYRAALLAIIVGYYVINWTRSGQTLGMRAWRLRAVNEAGRRMSVRAALLRYLCGVLAWAPAGLGVLWLYVDAGHLAVHDRLSRTRVVHLTGGS